MDWNEQSEDILERIRTNSVNLSEYHRRRFYHFKSYNKYFRLPCICLAVINSTASVGMTQFGASQEIASGTTCVIGMILALIGAVESYMNIPKQMDDEMKKSKDFYTLAIEIYKTLKLPRSERSEKASDYLTKKFGHYTKLMESSSLLKRKLKHDTLAKIKGSLERKRNIPIPKAEDVFQNLKGAYDFNKQFTQIDADGNPISLTPPTMEQAESIVAKGKAFSESPVVSTYSQGRDMRMAYGNLSVFPQPDGGVRIYDRWKVDSDLGGQKDQADRVGDLGEGGPIPSLIYNVAKNLGTYKPVDIDVTVPGDVWRSIEPVYPEREKFFIDKQIERVNQGPLLNTLNKIYRKFRPDQNTSPFGGSDMKFGN